MRIPHVIGKAEFITKSLRLLVVGKGLDGYLTVINQRDKITRVAVTQYIPFIFRHARRTIVVRNNIRDCCVRAIGTIDTNKGLRRSQGDLREHL